MDKKRHLFVMVMILSGIVIHCGKKLPPTSPDRWAPRVLSVKAEDRNHLRVFFSEGIDTTSGRIYDNYKIIDPESSETTLVIYSEREKRGDEVLLTIGELEDKKYTLLILNIRDLKGNVMDRAEKSFFPSSERDTIPPLLRYTKPLRMKTSAPLDSLILLRFSEPMDSLSLGMNSFLFSYMKIDSFFEWNETITEVSIRYKIEEGKICKIFILPVTTDLSGNPLGEFRILTFTSIDTFPKNRMSVKITREKKDLVQPYGFLSKLKDDVLQDFYQIDTTYAFSFYFTAQDTYNIYVVSRDSVDTTGFWWGQKQIAFFPDTSRSMNVDVSVSFQKKSEIPGSILRVYKILSEGIRSRK
jgi:hypothetical protein